MWILVVSLGLVAVVVIGRRLWRQSRDPAEYVSAVWLQAAIRERRQP